MRFLLARDNVVNDHLPIPPVFFSLVLGFSVTSIVCVFAYSHFKSFVKRSGQHVHKH